MAEAVISKPLAVALLDGAESVRRLKRLPVAPPPSGPHPETGLAAGTAAAVIDVAAAAITGVPCYADPDDAARALGHAVRYRAWRGRQRGKVPELGGLRAADARTVVTGFLASSPACGLAARSQRSRPAVRRYGVPLVATMAAPSEQEAVAAAAQLGGPVVLKAEAEGLVHRAGAGAVRVDLRTPGEVAEAIRTLAAGFGPRPQRVLVQPMLAGGVEVMIGVVQEPVFGPLVVLGSSAAAEVHGDQVARLTPLTDADAEEMINSVRAAPLLAGDWGRRRTPPGLADALLRVSRLADDLPEVSELNLDPVVARPATALGRWRLRVAMTGRAPGILRCRVAGQHRTTYPAAPRRPPRAQPCRPLDAAAIARAAWSGR